MSEAADRSRAAEASRWFTVMTAGDIDPADLAAFRAWRRDPQNAAAFAKVKAGWEAAGSLADRPAIVAATEAVLAKYPEKPGPLVRSRRFVLAPLGLGLASLLVVGGGIVAWQGREPSYVTKVGGQRLEVLADGSKVRLNTDSRVKVEFHEGERRVVLERGQAWFDVAHDASRPFVVVADGARVRALGTQFDVRRDDDAVRVTLFRGRVQVRGADGREAVLAPGDAVVAAPSGLSAPHRVDTNAVASWTTGRLTFSGAPLRDVVAEVNRYSERKVVLEAPAAVGDELVSGQFVAGDIDSFVAGARSLYGLKVVAETPREIRLAPG